MYGDLPHTTDHYTRKVYSSVLAIYIQTCVLQLAARGQNIILIARNQEKLDNVSSEIRKFIYT